MTIVPTLWSRLFNSTSGGHNWFWKQLVGYARSHALSVLETGIKQGQLIIQDQEGTRSYGDPKAQDPVTMVIHNDDFWPRLLLSLDMGLSEAYMNGDFDVSSLKGMFVLWLENRQNLQGLTTVMYKLTASASAFAINALGRQNLYMALENVVDSYDTSNEFFECFLSEEMMYSCALWDEAEHGIRGDLTHGSGKNDLHNAQMRKIHHILHNARVKPGYRLLEIGTGWGAMAIEAARLGCIVDTVTLSVPQKLMAEERARAAGVSDCVRVHLVDYRQLPKSFKGVFDAFVSCEMVEATGLRGHSAYFKMIDWALKPDRGAAVITANAQPEFRYSEYQPDDFSRHYLWPNTFLPNAVHFSLAAQEAVPGHLVLHSIEDHAPHYPRTLREWGYRFEKNFTGDVVKDVIQKHPELADPRGLEAFRRKWRYMFEYAAVGFARAYTALNCWTFVRPEYPVEPSD